MPECSVKLSLPTPAVHKLIHTYQYSFIKFKESRLIENGKNLVWENDLLSSPNNASGLTEEKLKLFKARERSVQQHRHINVSQNLC